MKRIRLVAALRARRRVPLTVVHVPPGGPIPTLIKTHKVDGRVYVARDDVVMWLRRWVDQLPEAERASVNEEIGKLERAQ